MSKKQNSANITCGFDATERTLQKVQQLLIFSVGRHQNIVMS